MTNYVFLIALLAAMFALLASNVHASKYRNDSMSCKMSLTSSITPKTEL
jgi:hypothetical protein